MGSDNRITKRTLHKHPTFGEFGIVPQQAPPPVKKDSAPKENNFQTEKRLTPMPQYNSNEYTPQSNSAVENRQVYSDRLVLVERYFLQTSRNRSSPLGSHSNPYTIYVSEAKARSGWRGTITTPDKRTVSYELSPLMPNNALLSKQTPQGTEFFHLSISFPAYGCSCLSVCLFFLIGGIAGGFTGGVLFPVFFSIGVILAIIFRVVENSRRSRYFADAQTYQQENQTPK